MINSLDRLVKRLGSSLIRLGRSLNSDSRAIFLFEDYHILDLLPDSLFIKNSKAEFLFGNIAVAKLMGVKDQKSLYGKTDFDFYPQGLAQSYFSDDMSVIKSGKLISVEEIVVNQTTGERRWFYSTKVPLKIGDEGIVYLLGIGRDISDRKKMESELASEKKLNFDIVENIPEEIMVVDKNGAIVRVNKAKRRSGDRLPTIGDKMYIDYASRHAPLLDMRGRLMKCIREGSGFDFKEIKYPYDDLQGKFLDVKVASIPDGAIIISRNVTSERAFREEAYRVKKLESLAVLAGGLAHDINNSLFGIFGNIDLVKLYLKKDTPETNKAITVLDRITNSRERAAGLSTQLLTFSKGGAPIKECIFLSDLVKESADFALSGSNVQPHYNLSTELSLVDVDKSQIGQVINNLIINAKQAMPDGGKIYIIAKNVFVSDKSKLPLNPGNYVRLSVKDTGCGIPVEDLSRIFDPCFTTKSTGHGLGLAICYSILNRHGGYIAVDSKIGKGSTFTIYLPSSTSSSDTNVSVDSLVNGSGKVLLMDDDPVVRTMFSESLKQIGYIVECAVNGTEAIDLYKKAKESNSPFDIAIMDLTVPGGMGGKEAIKILKEYDPNIKVIVCSGYADDPIVANPKEYGFNAGIAKPVGIEKLSLVVKKTIEE